MSEIDMTTATQTVKERPILFSGEMVRAILDGRKTQAREVIRLSRWIEQLGGDLERGFADKAFGVTPCLQVPCSEDGSVQRLRNPWMWSDEVPVRLWVREPLRADERGMYYDADATLVTVPDNFNQDVREYVPAAMMSRWASRVALEITNVSAQRLKEITESDAEAEGVGRQFRISVKVGNIGEDERIPLSYRGGFANSWNQTRGGKKYPWSSNPWVWVIEFRKV